MVVGQQFSGSIKKVIYISYQPLTEKIMEDFYLEYLRIKGFNIEYWDLSAIFFPGVQINTVINESSILFNSLTDVELHLAKQEIASCFFVIMVTYESRVVKLFQLLTKYNCITSIFARGMLPMPYLSIKSIFWRIRKAFTPKLLFAYFLNKRSFFLKKRGFIKPYTTVFNAGELGICVVGAGYEIEKRESKIVNLNSFDFERFISASTAENIIKEKYCVFLDEYLPYHPDFFMLNIETVPPDNYYRSLNAFFKILEKKFNLEVVIAAHPKAESYVYENPFEGRKIFFNKTAELSKYAEFALLHCSTSVSFPILNKIPVLFLYDNSIKTIMPNYFRFISFFSEIVGSQLVNTNDFSIKDIDLYTFDSNKYEDYKYKYLTSKESEGKKSVNIFFDYISNL